MLGRYLLAFALWLLVLWAWNIINPPPPPQPKDPQANVGDEVPRNGGPQPPPNRKGADPNGADRNGLKVDTEAQPGVARKDVQKEIPPPGPKRPQRPLKTEVVDFTAAALNEPLPENGAVSPSRFRFTADSRGGTLRELSLPEFRQTVEGDEPYTFLKPSHHRHRLLHLTLRDHEIPLDENWEMRITRERDAQGVERPEVVFENSVDQIHIRKSVRPPPKPDGDGALAKYHHVVLSIELENLSAEPKTLRYRVFGPGDVDSEILRGAGSDINMVYGRAGKEGTIVVDSVSPSSFSNDAWEQVGNVAWIGASNVYFASAMFPLTAGVGLVADHVRLSFARSFPDSEVLAKLAREKYGKDLDEVEPAALASLEESAYRNLIIGLESTKLTIPPGGKVRHEYGLFCGPRKRQVLSGYNRWKLPEVNQYGAFGLISLFIRLLDFLKGIAFESWGVAIVLLTVIVKLCLHPINKRSQGAMHRFQKKFQKVKPELDEIKEKHKNNRQKLHQEMQRLFKENNINPGQQMGGCLILLMQLPIWYALYRTLEYAIGLRHAGFLYIDDLTRPDALFELPFTVPILGWTQFNVLPVLYVILTIVNQRLQPRPEDPQMQAQYKMMTFMMVFFGVIFYGFPAGFMLYIMTSQLLGLIESKMIKAELAREDEDSGGTAAEKHEKTPAKQAVLYPAAAQREESRHGGGGERKRKKKRRR